MTLKLKNSDHDSLAGKVCPACGQTRPENSTTPAWQCPLCGVAYEKVSTDRSVTHQKSRKSRRRHSHHPARAVLRYPGAKKARWCEIIFLLMLALGFYTHGKKALPSPNDISSSLYQDPIQTFVHKPLVQFDYLNRTVEAKPVANYDLWGLIVSQNDNKSWLWGYRQDEVNFKDICVMWGDNLADGMYKHFTIWNKQWECFVDVGPRYAPFFHPSQFSNNHLLTDNSETREKIWHLQVGDQIHLTGQLVNYHYLQEAGSSYWRNSSIRRNDMGNGACEVILVKDVDVLNAHDPIYERLFLFSFILGSMALLGRLIIFFQEWRYYRQQMSDYTSSI